MRILGIDPGLSRTGFSVLEVDSDRPASPPAVIEAGHFRFDPKRSVASRLAELERDLDGAVARTKPTHAAVEAIYSHGEFPRTAITMAHARGVVLLCLERAKIEVLELPANTIKKAVAGHGHASKEQIAHAVASILALDAPPEPADVADAMAIALCASTRLLAETAG
ncbi:ruvC [Symbiodinium necroappetens]|uniref:RuvC protein n=1 Tax=Symbiodinium necroappetens TaxID=1628268 RepID=A0A812IRD6_9DINO|nr:ruvC [Symbiodinium necroappetens]